MHQIKGDNDVRMKLVLSIAACFTIFLCLPLVSAADVVPWDTESYRAFAQEDVWYFTSDEQIGTVLPLNASVDETCLGGYAVADSQITSTSMFVASGGASGGCGANHSTAIAEFEGTYTANNPLFQFSYDYTSDYGSLGGIYIANLTTSTILLNQSFGSSEILYVQTAIGDEIFVQFDLTSATCCDGGSTATLDYNMAVAPEPISSILFVAGGTLLAGRRYFKRKKKA